MYAIAYRLVENIVGLTLTDAARASFSAIPAGSFPRSAAAADTFATFITTEQFLWGLRRLLDGITAMVGPSGNGLSAS